MTLPNLRTLLCTLIAFIGTACISDSDEPVFSLAPGDPLPAFTVTLSDGTTVSNTTLLGNPAVIIFFNTTCPDCRRHLPELDRQYRQSLAQGNPTAYICIARAETAPTIQTFWEQNQMTLPWSPQPDDKIYSLFASRGIPRVYHVSPTGLITAVQTDTDL